MARLGWEEQHLARRLKSDPGKLAMAARLRTETTLPLKWIAARLQMGTTKSARPMRHHWMHYHAKQPCTQLQFQPPTAMINNTALQRWERLAAKQLDQMFKQRMMAGLNCSPFEAEAILQNVHETYSTYFQCAPGLQPGHVSLQVVSIEAPPGPRLRQCTQLLVTLTLEDTAADLPVRKEGGVTALRRHRLVRVCHEAFQQGGLLTLEDLACRLFNCGQRTSCRDLQALRQHRICPPLRSTIKDIGRTLSHRR